MKRASNKERNAAVAKKKAVVKKNTAPGSFIQHKRFLSDFNDNKVVLDVSGSNGDKAKLLELDLDSMTLSSTGGSSVYDTVLPISKFKNFAKTLKYLLNERLAIHDKSYTIRAEITKAFNTYSRFFSYLIQSGVYRLQDVTKDDIEQFSLSFIEHDGWWKLLRYDELLDSLYKKSLSEPELAKSIAGIWSKERTRLTINYDFVSNHIGLPLKGFHPGEFLSKVQKAHYKDTKVGSKESYKRDEVSVNQLRYLFGYINKLNTLSNDVDRISFIPYPNVQKLSKRLAKVKHDGRTRNVTPEYAVKVITTAYDWIYNKAPGVIELIQVARDVAEQQLPRDVVERSKGDEVRKAVVNKYHEIKDEYGFEPETIGVDNPTPNAPETLQMMIRIVQLACFNMVGINHGRRKNEILGEGDRSFGLYFGCVNEENPTFGMHSIDIYIEKTLRDWRTFWCNKIVYDSVKVLEDIYQLMRPLNTPPLEREPKDRSNLLKSDKLFTKHFLTGVDAWADDELITKRLQPLTYSDEAYLFFDMVDPDDEYYRNRSHINRRLFSVLYYYRYEFAELLALRDHLGHDGVGMTQTYVSDPDTRALSESMVKLWEKEVKQITDVHKEVQEEYFNDVIKQILNGNKVGGYWPRLVAKRVKTLGNKLKFDPSLSIDDISEVVSNNLMSKGYKANPKSNGACMIGESRISKRYANCYTEDINPQNAAPNVCSGCIHLFTNENYISVMDSELTELREKSKDFRLPAVVRIEAKKQADELAEVIEKERALSNENRDYLMTNIVKWNKGLGDD